MGEVADAKAVLAAEEDRVGEGGGGVGRFFGGLGCFGVPWWAMDAFCACVRGTKMSSISVRGDLTDFGAVVVDSFAGGRAGEGRPFGACVAYGRVRVSCSKHAEQRGPFIVAVSAVIVAVAGQRVPLALATRLDTLSLLRSLDRLAGLRR